jgi:hypothetical protein
MEEISKAIVVRLQRTVDDTQKLVSKASSTSTAPSDLMRKSTGHIEKPFNSPSGDPSGDAGSFLIPRRPVASRLLAATTKANTY